jgi:hypothetical protein
VYGAGYWVALGAAALLALLASFNSGLTRDLVNVVVLLTFLALAAFLRPFDGAAGTYDAAAQHYAENKDVWVPCNFRAHDEGDRFMLPGARVHGYDESWNLTPDELAARYRLFALQLPLGAEPCAGCRVMGQRLEIRGRQSPAELGAMLRGDVFKYLFVKELLLESSRVDAGMQNADKEGCR